jgi:hypothetical protein
MGREIESNQSCDYPALKLCCHTPPSRSQIKLDHANQILSPIFIGQLKTGQTSTYRINIGMSDKCLSEGFPAEAELQ